MSLSASILTLSYEVKSMKPNGYNHIAL
ncbi:hypothetical protein MTBUT4_260027 [Magnetospirillum sp. UT-4]|nr:hypothetical protein MTBUT4_260027 [Magnetospirillum sp. UT-4]